MRRLAAGTALALLATTGPAALGAPGENPFEDARRAAERTPFQGLVQVRWRDGPLMASRVLSVQAANGVVEVRGDNSLRADRKRLLVQHAGSGWDLVWPERLGPHSRPDLSRKYRTATGTGPRILDRATELVDVTEGATLRERLYFDAETGLLLRREQYDRSGQPVRIVAFESLAIGFAPQPPRPPVPHDRAPERVAQARLAGSRPAPATLPGGFRRISAYRWNRDTLQVLYGDGLYDLSVFEQAGRLAWRHPEGTQPVRVGGRAGWRSTWAGGHVVVWQTGHRVYTVVSDAPIEDVLLALRSLPSRPRPASTLAKLRHACRALVDPIGTS